MLRTCEGLGYRVWRYTCKNVCRLGRQSIDDKYCIANYGKRAARKTCLAGPLRVSLASERLTSALFVGHTYGHISNLVRCTCATVSTMVQKHRVGERWELCEACDLRMRTARQAGIKYLAFPVLCCAYRLPCPEKMLRLEHSRTRRNFCLPLTRSSIIRTPRPKCGEHVINTRALESSCTECLLLYYILMIVPLDWFLEPTIL